MNCDFIQCNSLYLMYEELTGVSMLDFLFTDF